MDIGLSGGGGVVEERGRLGGRLGACHELGASARLAGRARWGVPALHRMEAQKGAAEGK
jgi:hypothetical protein